MSVFRLATLALVGSAAAIPHVVARQSSLDDFLTKQEPISQQGVLDNIGPDGAKVEGASAGIVVASPSKSEPDYFYTWTRDASLTIKALVDRFLATGDSVLEDAVKNFVSSQATLQRVNNPSGGISTGGLGEPKFHVDMTAFTGEWGRPQRDGPALRATALIAYANHLLSQGDTDTVKNTIWPIVTSDLQYVASTWNQTGFDLWEEVQGTSFFTLVAQHRSLIEGIAIASEIGVECIDCEAEAPAIRCLMSQLWNEEGYMMSDINNSHERTGKGTNTVIASIHSFDQEADCDDATFQPCSSKALSNLKLVADSMRSWDINSGVQKSEAPALGRYIEDVYMGGNPWYLTTTAAAEQLYYALATWERLGSFTIDGVSLGFFQDIYESASEGTYESGSTEYTDITGAVRNLAEGYMAVVQKYTPGDGSLAEQFSKTDGTPLSAVHLTWSYAALLTSKAARDGHLPPSWGASGISGAC